MKKGSKKPNNDKNIVYYDILEKGKAPAAVKKHFGIRVMRARVESNMERDELAGMLGISMQGVRLIENGNRFPSVEVLYNLCNALQVSPAYLMRDELQIQIPDTYERFFSILDKATPHQAEVIVEMMEVMCKHLDKKPTSTT